MKVIKNDEVFEGSNSEKCKIFGYPFEDKDMDICVSVITGRYPDSGYCKHLVCKELIYVLEGSGKLHFEDKVVDFAAGDAVWVNPNEKYYFIIGKESTGIPKEILKKHLDSCIRLPINDKIRSLNISNVAAIVIFEALRQQDYNDLSRFEPETLKGKDWLLK